MTRHAFDLELVGAPEGEGERLFIWGRLTFGHFSDEFQAPLYDWAPGDYTAQWLEAASRLVEGAECAVFLTHMMHPGAPVPPGLARLAGGRQHLHPGAALPRRAAGRAVRPESPRGARRAPAGADAAGRTGRPVAGDGTGCGGLPGAPAESRPRGLRTVREWVARAEPGLRPSGCSPVPARAIQRSCVERAWSSSAVAPGSEARRLASSYSSSRAASVAASRTQSERVRSNWSVLIARVIASKPPSARSIRPARLRAATWASSLDATSSVSACGGHRIRDPLELGVVVSHLGQHGLGRWARGRRAGGGGASARGPGEEREHRIREGGRSGHGVEFAADCCTARCLLCEGESTARREFG